MLALANYQYKEFSRYASPHLALLVSYSVGAAFGAVLKLISGRKNILLPKRQPFSLSSFAYLTGISGAMAAIVIFSPARSELGFAGTLSLLVLGQVIMNIVADTLGLLGLRKRAFTVYDFGQLCFTMLGVGVLLFFSR